MITDYKEYHTDTTVRFVITFMPGEFQNLRNESGGFHRVFKLSSSMSTASMHAFDNNNCLRKFEKVNQILAEFYEHRSLFYVKRKDYLTGMLEAEADKLSDQARFILEKCNNTLVVENKKRKTMIEELIRRGYKADPVKEWKRKISMEDEEDKAEDEVDGEEEDDEGTSAKAKVKPDPEKAFAKLNDVQRYDYLLGMSMWMLTDERKNDLLKQRDNKLSELNLLKARTPNSLWIEDLDALEKKLNEVEQKEREDESGTIKKTAKAMLAQSKGAKGAAGRKRPEKKSLNDIYPSADGEKVEFKVTEDILKKYEKMAGADVRKKEKQTKKKAGEVDGTGTADVTVDGEDEFDNMIGDGDPTKKPKPKVAAAKVAKEPKEPKAKKEPKPKKEKDGLKQTKLSYKVKKSSINFFLFFFILISQFFV